MHRMSSANQEGVTLIEVLLGLVIGASLILLGLQTYQQFNDQGNINKAQYNINVLFQGLRGFYLSNCINNRNYTTGNVMSMSLIGALDPSYLPADVAQPSYPIPITTLLADAYVGNWNAGFSPIITNYVVQLNLYNNTTYPGYARNVQFCYSGTCSSETTVATDNIYLWTAQVAVQVGNVAKIQLYKSLLGADCISSLAGSIVTPCSQSPTANDYLVFERLPSFATTDSNSPLWMSIPMLKLFKAQYTNDEDYAVTTRDNSYFQGSYQNYLCGG